MNRTPQAVQTAHDLLKWMIPCLDKFPRKRRYSLGSHLEHTLLQVLESLVAAAYARDKRAELALANRKLGIVMHLWRLSEELRLTSKRQYRHGSALILDLGRQTGGWLKSA